MTDETTPRGSAFEFTGTWREFAPIAFTNLLLTIVTLGIYRFWAKTRTRHYLWSRTHFIGDPLEWTGTGKELLIGFLIALPLFGIPLVALNILGQSLLMRGELAWGQLVGLLTTLCFLYIVGIARFRALRYRLSRTFWHGIRGGSNEKGALYGWSYLWKTIVGGAIFGLLIPWSMCSLWNQRWNTMSFGPYEFEADADPSQLLKRLLICFGAGIVAVIGSILIVTSVAAAVGVSAGGVAGFFSLLLVVAVIAVCVAAYYAAFMREAIKSLSLNRITFGFTARARDWAKLFLGDLALLLVTLGLGFVFIGYRHWRFLIVHLEAYGEVHLAELSQSATEAPTQGEGLLDAFDVGAF